MQNKLIEFLPSEIGDIEDFKQIMSSETLELELLENKQEQFFNENFIDTATSKGIKHQEKLFKIRADLENETLEFRKLRIKSRKINKAPFTYRFLESKLKSLFGKGNYKLTLINDKYILKVEINTLDWYLFDEIINNFRTIIPCNIKIISLLINKINTYIYFSTAIYSGEEVTVYPYGWKPPQILSKGNLINNPIITSTEQIVLYPKGGK